MSSQRASVLTEVILGCVMYSLFKQVSLLPCPCVLEVCSDNKDPDLCDDPPKPQVLQDLTPVSQKLFFLSCLKLASEMLTVMLRRRPRKTESMAREKPIIIKKSLIRMLY